MCKKLWLVLVIFTLAALFVQGIASADNIRVQGTLSRIDPAGNSLVVSTKDGFVTVRVDVSTNVQNYGKAAVVAELRAGDRIALNYDPETMIATSVSAKLPLIKGHVTSIDRGPLMTTIAVAPLGAAAVSMNILTSTRVERDHQFADAGQLAANDSVEATYNPVTGSAEKITILPPRSTRVEGVIQAIYETRGGDVRVRIMKRDLTQVIVNVGMTADVERTGVSILPFQMRKGENLLSFYDVRGMQALFVWVWGPEVRMLEGTIIDIQYPSKLFKFASVTVGTPDGEAPKRMIITGITTYERNQEKGTFGQVQVKDPSRSFYNPLTKEMIHLETWTTK